MVGPTLYMRLSVFHDQDGTRILRAEVPGYGAVAGFDKKYLPGMLINLAEGAHRWLRPRPLRRL